MRQFALSCVLAASLALPAFAEEVTIATAQGDVTLPAQPQKVAVFDIAAIDSLTALGVAVAGAPEKTFMPYLQDATKDAAKIGTLFEPNLETLAGLGPDLIIIGGRSAAQKAAVEQVGTTIDMTISPDLLTDAKARIDAYGKLFAKTDEATALNATLDEKIAALQEASKGKGKALVILTNGPKMSASGKGSRFGWIYDATGLPEAVENLKVGSHGDAISHEFIAEANPDWLFVIDRGAAVGGEGQSAEATLTNPLIEGTNAWKNGRVAYLPPANMYISGAGYNSLVETLDQLTAAVSK